MERVRRGEIVRTEREMEFFLADVVGLRMVAQPRELEFKVGSVVADIHDDIRAVSGFLAPLFVQAERFLVKRK